MRTIALIISFLFATICKGQQTDVAGHSFADTNYYKVDTVIKSVLISNQYFGLKMLRSNSSKTPGELTLLIIAPRSGKIVLQHAFAENEYNIFKIYSSNLNAAGKLFIDVTANGGGSGFSAQCFEITLNKNVIRLSPVYRSDELSLFYYMNENDIIKLQGIWNFKEEETHFSAHRLSISRYTFVNGKFKERSLGTTQHKYDGFDDSFPSKKILLEIKKKEPGLLRTISVAQLNRSAGFY